MKLTPEQKLIEAAKLDGFQLQKVKSVSQFEPSFETEVWCRGELLCAPLNYPESYDAIIPLIQKQDEEMINKTLNYLLLDGEPVRHVFNANPSQLLDALLSAKGFEV